MNLKQFAHDIIATVEERDRLLSERSQWHTETRSSAELMRLFGDAKEQHATAERRATQAEGDARHLRTVEAALRERIRNLEIDLDASQQARRSLELALAERKENAA